MWRNGGMRCSSPAVGHEWLEPEGCRQLNPQVSKVVRILIAMGLCCLATDGAAIVDAAHIEPFEENQINDTENGLALCMNWPGCLMRAFGPCGTMAG